MGELLGENRGQTLTKKGVDENNRTLKSEAKNVQRVKAFTKNLKIPLYYLLNKQLNGIVKMLSMKKCPVLDYVQQSYR